MRFGERIRGLRTEKGLSQRGLSRLVGVSFAYISKIESGKLDFGDYPSAALIGRLAQALGADEDELMLLAEKIPEPIRRRFFERPEAFRQLAQLDDRRFDRLLASLARDGSLDAGPTLGTH
ncbi:MAG: helix-turn-helix transcriptional regulator [Gemmataceae bacterium]